VEWKNISRVCNRKAILTVNGEYPGPTIAVNEGEQVEIKVTNGVPRNTTIHWLYPTPFNPISKHMYGGVVLKLS
ncbi:Cupredoxin, partial [Cynara cardunculus var. scolymus]